MFYCVHYSHLFLSAWFFDHLYMYVYCVYTSIDVCVCVCVCVFWCVLVRQVLRDSGMMEEREYQTYRSLFSNMSNFM